MGGGGPAESRGARAGATKSCGLSPLPPPPQAQRPSRGGRLRKDEKWELTPHPKKEKKKFSVLFPPGAPGVLKPDCGFPCFSRWHPQIKGLFRWLGMLKSLRVSQRSPILLSQGEEALCSAEPGLPGLSDVGWGSGRSGWG